MKLTINETTIDIVSAELIRDIKYGVYLSVKIPDTAITEFGIRELFEGNTETIFITNDDEKVKAYNGYSNIAKYHWENGYYLVAILCNSETQHQINMLQDALDEQKTANKDMAAMIENYKKIIETQDENILALNEQLLTTQMALCELYESGLSEETETNNSETEEVIYE